MKKDPFGKNRMIYTVKNCCVEEPALLYEDGARTVFLYTGGTEGEPPEELRQLARYMEDFTARNAKSPELARLHEMVTGVKSDREVGLAYMKSFEVEKRIRNEGIAEGTAEAIMDLLKDIGSVPETLGKQIRGQRNLETLREWHKLAARSKSMEEFERMISAEGLKS